MNRVNKDLQKKILLAQRQELTEFHIYSKLAKIEKDSHNKKILLRIAKDEKIHHDLWKKVTKQETKPRWFFVYWYIFISRVLGLSFGLKLMERGENLSQHTYSKLAKPFPFAKRIEQDERKHEMALLSMLREERLSYASSIVLGLNDALVELTGALAGLTFALQNSRIVAISGLITGVAAALSMGASGYLSSKEEESDEKHPIKSALYTGVAYLITVALLVTPYFVVPNLYAALGVMLAIGILVIFMYTYYISIAKSMKFWHRFLEMATISITVAIISFGVGILLRTLIGIEA